MFFFRKFNIFRFVSCKLQIVSIHQTHFIVLRLCLFSSVVAIANSHDLYSNQLPILYIYGIDKLNTKYAGVFKDSLHTEHVCDCSTETYLRRNLLIQCLKKTV